MKRATHSLIVKYTNIPEAMDAFSDLRQAWVRREPGSFILLYGESRVGKTTIVKQFCRQEQARILRETGRHAELYKYGLRLKDGPYGDERPIVYVDSPGERSLVSFSAELLQAYGTPVARSLKKSEILGRLRTQIEGQKTQVLIIDDFQNAVPWNRGSVIHELSELVKDLLEHTRVQMILSGLPYADIPLERNEQLDGRCRDRLHVQPFPWARPKAAGKSARISRNAYQSYLEQFEAALALPEPSNLADPDRAERIHKATGGLIGRTTRLLIRALEIGLKNDVLHISDKHLEMAYDRTKLTNDKSNPIVDDLDDTSSGYRAAVAGKTICDRMPIRLRGLASDGPAAPTFAKNVRRN
ncbi:ATP-binding protein [Methylobacterium sp.]|uniref:AAA family ATPase n=1 Tax=Methylobacterium sp. TaxID=409 RepID=UPI0025D53371|nr:ATP-binding protein [Methylobacterium sp.]MBY0257514.1 ATP-binding protein [Methylobacterium sp.]